MRVVLDTNILVSALLIQLGIPAAVYRAWHEGHFTLLTCPEQLNELRATLSKPALAARIKPYHACQPSHERRPATNFTAIAITPKATAIQSQRCRRLLSPPKIPMPALKTAAAPAAFSTSIRHFERSSFRAISALSASVSGRSSVPSTVSIPSIQNFIVGIAVSNCDGTPIGVPAGRDSARE
jgi:hypothetical protein